MKYFLITNTDKQGLINQRLTLEGGNEYPYNITDTIEAWILDTRELQIRDALIALGWTPPQRKK